MAQRDHYEIDGSKDASEYYWRGEKGERKAYAKAYASARDSNFNSVGRKYADDIAKGGTTYDKARMKDEADSVAAKYERMKDKRLGSKKKGKKAAKKKTARKR